MAERPNVEDVFEAWAHVAARIRKRPQAEQRSILATLGIGPEWDAVHEQWSRRLNEDIVANRMDRPERYALICRQEQQRRDRSAGAPAVPAAAPPPPAPPPPAPPPPALPPPAPPPPAPPIGARYRESESAPATQPPPAMPAPEASPSFLRPAGAQPLGAQPLGGQPLGGPPAGVAPPAPLPLVGQAAELAKPIGVGIAPALGIQIPAQATPPMRRRAETLDLKEPPRSDAVPFGRTDSPARPTDFRDALTPRKSKPNHPWMTQEKTLPSATERPLAGDPPAAVVAAGTAPEPPAAEANDFRRDLGGVSNQRPAPPKPNQSDTQSNIDLAATVEAARQISAVVAWSVERWARLYVAIERAPQLADELWRAQGVSSAEAREHAQRKWQQRLESSPSLRSELMGHLARFRALP